MRGTFLPLTMGVMWSLGVEEQFYATLPLLVRWASPARLVGILLAVIALVPLGRTVAYFALPHGGLAAYALMPFRADSLLLGVVAALLVRSRLGWAYLTSHRGHLKVLLAVLSLGLLALMVKSPGMDSMGMATFGYSWLALFFVTILLLALTRPEGRLGSLLAHRWLRWLGDIAYGTYMLHVGVLGVCFGLVLRRAPQMTNLTDLAVTVLAGFATLALARVSWLYFEKPLVARGHGFQY
jgi:peptidoglycan/LPS O-acetylase OafA/YrhL